MIKKLGFICITFFVIHFSVFSQTSGIAFTSVPEINMVKYPSLNSFISSYQEMNNTNAELFPKTTVAWNTGVDIMASFIYFGLHYTHNSYVFEEIALGPYKTRNMDLDMRYTICNVGFNLSKNNLGIMPFVTTGMHYIDFNTYLRYYDTYNSYGQTKTDGFYSGNNIIAGWGLKAYYTYKILYVSAGITKMGSIFTENLHDFDPQKMDQATDYNFFLASDWEEYNSVPMYEYNKGYVSSKIKTTAFNIAVGVFLGESN